jgi:hypothetical protein
MSEHVVNDLPELWQQHTDHEFVTRDTEATITKATAG